jgi:ThiF family protein
MRYVLKIDEHDFSRLEELLWAKPGVESAAFLLAGIYQRPTERSLLVRRVIEIPPEEYRVRNGHRIELTPRAINGLAALCEANGLMAVLAHSHPSSVPYSPSDDHGEARIAATLRAFTPQPELGSILMTPACIYGRVWRADGKAVPISDIVVVGRAIRRVTLDQKSEQASPRADGIHARQVIAFGELGQQAIAGLKVGIVGTGGTGSPLAEQLVRLGVRDVVLVDRDEFEKSNISRVYGSFARHAAPAFWKRLFGRNRKVDVVARHLREINPHAQIRALDGDVTESIVANQLLDRDVLFACTDEHWGRSIINQIAYQYLIPALNLGMAITSNGSEIEAGVGVVQMLRPGHGCLWCSGFLSADRIRAEALTPTERASLAREGYVGGLDEVAPSVVTVTTTVAALAGTWLIQLATDFMGGAGDFSRQNYDLMAGTVRRGRIQQDSTCICSKVKGKGDLTPLPVRSGRRT